MMKEGLEAIENASRDEISALQLRRLRASVTRCYSRVAPYRAKCEARGVHPDDLRELTDLAKFPYTEKEDLRANYPFGMLAVAPDELARVHASSGTTGRPTVVGYTAADIDTWAQVCARSIYAAGGRRGDVVHIAYGYGLFTGGLGAHYGAEKLGCAVVPASGGATERQALLIADLRPAVIMVTPSYMLNIADALEARGVGANNSLRAGIFGAEPWTDAMRDEIEARAGLDAVDIYGLSEIIGPGVACECVESKDGPHIWEDHFFPEIADPNSGEVLADGEFGELILTTLTKEAAPLIRYRTRDLTRLLPGSARAMRRMEKITGRADDMLIIRGVNLFPSQIEELVLASPALAPHYQLQIERENNLDSLTVFVEARAGESAAKSAGEELSRRIKELFALSAAVAVAPPGGVERSAGKARRVIDKRKK
jgi:phenylacetate-CoA ligase